MKRSSIGSWAYTIGPYAACPVDFETVCSKLAELGFAAVELGGFPPHPNPGNPNGPNDNWAGAMPARAAREELKARMKERGLAFSGLAANLWGEHLIDTDDQRKYVAEFTKNAEFARDLGIPVIRVDSVQPPTLLREIEWKTAFDRIVRTWRTCADIAAGNGLTVAWEFEPGFAFNKPGEIVRIHDAVDRLNFGILYDTCHGQMVGVNGARQEGEREVFPSQVDFIRLLSGRIMHLHLIDSDNTCHKTPEGADETSTHPPFGCGVLDFDVLMPELVKASHPPHDFWTIDLCFWPDAWEATASSKTVLDALIRKYGASA